MFFRSLFSSQNSNHTSTVTSSTRTPTPHEFGKLDEYIRNGDLERFKQLIESENLNVNAPHSAGLTLLHKIVAASISQLQQRLQQAQQHQRTPAVAAGPAVTTAAAATSSATTTANTEATIDQSADTVAFLRYLVKERNADVHISAKDGTTPFDSAVFDGILPIVLFFIEEGDYSVDNVSAEGYSAAFLACHDDTIETLRYLIDNGCSVDAPPQHQRPMARAPITHTPFYAAALSGSVSAVQALLDAGCDLKLAADALGTLPETEKYTYVSALLKAEFL